MPANAHIVFDLLFLLLAICLAGTNWGSRRLP
jgi:hypothetical protein